MRPLKSGDVVYSAVGTLAHFCGDRLGIVDRIEGDTIWCRMQHSGRMTPFREEQLERASSSSAREEGK